MATDNKYDRQLRLWGSEGQYLLNSCKVLVLGSSGLASEILKNLVLPGIGFFTIVDTKKVSETDFGDNFFMVQDDISKSRAEVVKNWLLELNPDVQGESLEKSFDELIALPDFFTQYNLIIASQLNFDQIRLLSHICESNNKQLIVAKSKGLLGYLRLFASEHLVVESKPTDKEILDLHLNKPFAELVEFTESFDLNNCSDIEHGHIPYIVLLLKLRAEFEHVKGKPIENFEEKTQFKNFIKSKSRDFGNELNFQEAIAKSYLCFLSEDLPDEVVTILNDPESTDAGSHSKEFWIFAKSVKEFIDKNAVSPLTGIFPDMTSDTASYIALQEIYKNKSESDYLEVLSNYRRIKGSEDEPESLRKFCRNLHTLEVTRFNQITSELSEINKEWLQEAEDDGEELEINWYLALRSFEEFKSLNNRSPEKNDIEALNGIAERIYRQVPEEILEEIIRFADTELHCISAFVGGVASQEAVKLITKQYSPINNTFIFNGVHTKAQVLKL